MDLQKLKVPELRAELQARNLDTKGVKAQLIDRLKEAMDLEQQQSDSSAAPPSTSAVSQQQEEPDTPRLRRSSRSRTKSPEPIITKIQDPSLEAVQEEEDPEETNEDQKDTEMYEKIIDEMDVDQNQQPDDEYDEDALLAESDQPSSSKSVVEEQKKQEDQNGEQQKSESAEQMNEETTEGESEEKPSSQAEGEEENRGVKRRAESPSKETSPKKRQRLPPPNIDDFVNDEDEPELDESLVQLSWFDSDLNLKIDRETFCSAQSLFDTGLALVWAGARANYGAIANGKYFYEVQLLLFNNKISYPNERNLHEIRCGWSLSNSSLQLGESELSFALDSSGKKCVNSEFTDYTTKLITNDVIGVHLELTDEKCSIAYTVNGKNSGIAFEFERSTLSDQALFPHISTKNVEYKVNFGSTLDQSLWTLRRDGYKEQELKRRRNELEKKKKDIEKKREEKAEKLKKESEAKATAATTTTAAEATESEENSEEKPVETVSEEQAPPEEVVVAAATVDEEDTEPELPEDITEDEIEQEIPSGNCLPDYKFIANIPIDQLSKGPRRPENRTDCEVIMMIGLPGAGKSHWALQHAKEFPEKRYTMLGTKYLLEKMKIAGQPRKRQNNAHIRWEKLIELCNRGLLTLNEIACKRRRNFILDQPHVYISDQRRKMRVYGDFKRIACIVVPKEEDYKVRIKKRLETEGKDIHDAAVNEMRANITLPELEYLWFNEIIYSDLEKEAAVEEVSKENERGKRALNQRNRQPNFNPRGGQGNFNQPRGNWGGNQRNDFRRNNWGPPNRPMNNPGFNRNFDGGNRSRNNWSGPDNNNWNRGGARSGGYGGGPPPRPGQQQHQKRPGNQQQNRNDRFRQGGNNNRGGHKDNRGMKKFGNSDWSQGGGGGGGAGSGGNNKWGGNWGNNYQNWNNQWNQYGGSNSNNDNSGDTNSQWMAYYQQQQQQQNQNWFSSDGNYGGAFSSNSNYDQTKQ